MTARVRAAVVPLSTIIPTYNHADLLPRAIESVLSQADERVELIVVDDGSSDDTVAVLTKAQEQYGPRLQVIRQANSGAAAARNTGLRASRGQHVLFLDADDELLPGALQVILETLAARPATGLLLGGSLKIHLDGRERCSLPVAVPDDRHERLIQYLLRKRISIGHGSMVAERSLLQACPYPERLRCNEDIPVFAYLLSQAEVATVRQPLVRIFKYSGSLRHQLAEDRGIGLRLVEEVFDRLPAACQPLRSRYAAQRSLSLFRSTHLAGDRKAARQYYRQAFALDWRQAMRWAYLRKALRLWMHP